MADTATNTGATAPGSALTAPVHTGNLPVVHDSATSLPAIVRRNVAVLRPIADAVVLVQVQAESRELIAKLLKDGKDYGVVPGVKKPSLFKPGAEKFNAAYGLVARFIVVEKEVDHYAKIDWTKTKDEWSGPRDRRRKTTNTVAGTSFGLYRYVINCELIDRATGEVVGSSLGSCSTLESKYVDRPRDLENTVIKMAEKRAYIGATLLTHGLSEQFTQDVEDTGVASDDTQAVAVQEPDPMQNLPEVGSSEWAITYPIPSGIRTGMKLPETVTTFGQLGWKQLEHIAEAMDAISAKTPARKEACDEVSRAARRMQDELDERAAIGGEAVATGEPATAAGDDDEFATKPGDPAPKLPDKLAKPVSMFTKPGTAALNPLASDGGAVPPARAQDDGPKTADGLPVSDKLPF